MWRATWRELSGDHVGLWGGPAPAGGAHWRRDKAEDPSRRRRRTRRNYNFTRYDDDAARVAATAAAPPSPSDALKSPLLAGVVQPIRVVFSTRLQPRSGATGTSFQPDFVG